MRMSAKWGAWTACAVAIVLVAGCRVAGRGPGDEEVIALVTKTPPSPPTLGPTRLVQLAQVEIQERGTYNTDGKYWPIRVRVRGGARLKLTNVFQLGVIGDPDKLPLFTTDFVEEAHFKRDDFGKWRVVYAYDRGGAKWRLEEATAASEIGRGRD